MIAEPSMPERRPSPGLTLNLSSNNPFRSRTGSPAIPSPALPTSSSTGSRPMSRNPFLATFEAEFNKEASRERSPQPQPQPLVEVDMSAKMSDSPKKATFGNSAEELFNNLSLDPSPDKRPDQSRGPPPRNGSVLIQGQGHRPSRSQGEDKDKLRQRGPPPRGAPRPRGPPGSRPLQKSSPERRESRRARRNSESSMVDKGSLPEDEERRRRERRKERDARAARDGKTRRVRKPQGLDIIDKLDVSGIYGPSLIHHDGPYDAVRPHRNRKKDERAPMHAFPKGSANNALGGSGPVNKNIDLETFHGRGAEGFTDYSGSGDPELKKRPELEGRSVSFNPKGRADIIHGEESVGLGTSTFLDGAPASRAAIQQREIDAQRAMVDGGSLGRKKSIAQRFRGISQPRRGFNDGNPRIQSPDARFGPATSPLSGGGTNRTNESNPYFDDYNDAYERKGATIKVAESTPKDQPVKSPSSPKERNPLTRALTSDGLESPTETKSGNAFINRVKSLKGGKRAPRPERPT